MRKVNAGDRTGRRHFLGKLTASVASLGISGLCSPLEQVQAEIPRTLDSHNPDEWFQKMAGKHRMVYDVIRTVGLAPFAWARAFLSSNQETGSPPNECNVVIVLRAEGIPYAFNSEIWAKYNFGVVFKVDDPTSKKPSMHNPFWQPEKGLYNVPGIGALEIGINELQDSGVMFCVCNTAIRIQSAILGKAMNIDAAEVNTELLAGLLPGIQVMPSGVWALGRAQEHGCSYCYAS
jgi:intracellular sulfur oxidation DsrE/DsrF family protein